jgi:hypothetical protein
MVRIHLPPAVSQANFCIPPLARPDLDASAPNEEMVSAEPGTAPRSRGRRRCSLQGNQGPAQIVRLGHRGTPSIDVSDEIGILAARPIASLRRREMDSNFQYASTERWHRATDLPLPPTVKRRSAGRPPPNPSPGQICKTTRYLEVICGGARISAKTHRVTEEEATAVRL